MPDTIRISGGCAHPWQRGFLAAVVAAIGGGLPVTARADQPTSLALHELVLTAQDSIDRHEIAVLAMVLGLIFFTVVTAIMLLRARAGATRLEAWSRDEIAALRGDLDRANALLLSEPQVLVDWPAASDEPSIDGDPAIVGVFAAHRVLAFGTWLEAGKARAMEQAVEALRTRGEGFAMTLTTLAGHPVEAHGRAIGGRAVLRLKDASGVKRDLASLLSRHESLLTEVASLRTLIETLPSPVWTRDAAGDLIFVNAAYARAVEAKDTADAVQRRLELLDSAARENIAQARTSGGYSGRLPAVVAGTRRTFDVFDFRTETGSAGIGIDATEAETMRVALARLVDAHRRTLDLLSAGVAMFDADHRLSFYNAAYRALWELDAGFLDQHPADSAVIEQLRTARKLPEEQDFRQWKAELHEAYRAVEPKEYTWHLPDGRTLRVVTTPNPDGGVTYLFHDVTERLDLERRFEEMIRFQGETLDNLAEGVAVFASDGRIRLHNPAFARMWRLSPQLLAERPHIEKITTLCQPLHGDDATWQALREVVTAIDNREAIAGRRLERRDGSVVDCTALPLPDGATLVTFHDVTDSVNVERALRERNEALEDADRIKIDFVHHVSYELRSPLTNIIGFVHLLGDPSTGPLAQKQREYLDYITVSTTTLLALINNILDLATIDAGRMQLNLGSTDIRATMEAAAEGVQDRLVGAGLVLDIRAAPDIGSFVADDRRLRQVLFNLLANAVSFSPGGATVTLLAERSAEAVVFSVTDRGPGIPPDVLEKVFDWFESHSLGSQHRGPGIGLSLVRSFVELHGGTVTIASAVGQGTTVTCTFPIRETAALTAA